MSTNINTNKYVGVGKRFISPASVSGCVFPGWSSAYASTYWNALTTANGGVEVNGSLYGITTCALKNAINQWYIDLASGGIASMKGAFLYIGGTAATHAINAWPGSNLLFTGGIPSPLGTTFNGTSDYADTQYDSSSIPPGSIHLSTRYTVPIGVAPIQTLIGSADGIGPGTSYCTIDYRSAITAVNAALYSESSTTSSISLNVGSITSGFAIADRRISTIMTLTNDALVGTATGAYAGIIPNYNIYIAALNQGGILTGRFAKTTISFSSYGEYLNGSVLKTATNTLNTTLGR